LAFERGRQATVDATFSLDGDRAALGFSLDVDALRMTSRVPVFFAPDSPYRSDAQSMRSFRAAHFQHIVQTDDTLLDVANSFQLQWLSELYMSVVVERALRDQISLEVAHASLESGSIATELKRALDVVFQALPNSTDADVPAVADDAEPRRQRLHGALTDLADNQVVTTRLSFVAEVLWRAPDDSWELWAAERYAATLGAAVLEGVDRVCRDVGAQNLVLDTAVEHKRAVCEVWLSEPSIGGGGIVEEFVRRYTDDPRRFFHLVEAALAPSDFEIVDHELVRTLGMAVNTPAVTQCFADVRLARSQAATTSSVRTLLATLVEQGVAVSHPVIAALNARVLRPGSSHRTDTFLHNLVTQWHSEERRLGLEIDARVFAFVASDSDEVDRVVPPPLGVVDNARQRRFATIYGLLWPRGSAVRASSLRAYNPYHDQPPTDRALVLSALRATTPVVPLRDANWRDLLATALVDGGSALLAASPADSRSLRHAIMEVQGIPVDAGFLMLHPRVIGFARDAGELRVRLELREAFQ